MRSVRYFFALVPFAASLALFPAQVLAAECSAAAQSLYGVGATGSCFKIENCKAPFEAIPNEGNCGEGEICCADKSKVEQTNSQFNQDLGLTKGNLAEQKNEAQPDVKAAQGSSVVLPNPLGKGATIYTVLRNIIQTFLGMVGSIALLVFVYAGVIWMTARENAKQVQQAKDAMQAAVTGILLIAFAYTITTFVISKVTPAPQPNVGMPNVPTADDAALQAD